MYWVDLLFSDMALCDLKHLIAALCFSFKAAGLKHTINVTEKNILPLVPWCLRAPVWRDCTVAPDSDAASDVGFSWSEGSIPLKLFS